MDAAKFILGACSGAHIVPPENPPSMSTVQRISTRAWFPAQHAGFQGHFPGNALLPGFLHVELVLDILRLSFSHIELQAVQNAKFLRPVLAEEIIIVLVSLEADGGVAAQLHISGMVVSELVLEVSLAVAWPDQKS